MKTSCLSTVCMLFTAVAEFTFGFVSNLSGAEIQMNSAPSFITNWVYRTNPAPYTPTFIGNSLFTAVDLSVQSESPQDQHADLGQTAVFKVSSNFDDALYQWQFQCVRIEGATNDTLVVPNITEGDAGYYTCVVYRGMGFVVSQPMQLIVVKERSATNIVLAAKAPPGLGGMAGEPVPIMQILQKPPGAKEKTSSNSRDPWLDGSSRNMASTPGAPPASGIAAGAASLSAMMWFMQVPPHTNVIQNYMYTVSATGTGCPRPYSGYLRFTTGWYPKPGATTIRVYGPGAPSYYSAITFDDTTRQGCGMGNSLDLMPYQPVSTRPHRFVAFLQTAPNSSTTYYLHLTGFQ